MAERRTITIGDKEFEILDAIDNITIADSFVLRNKRSNSTGHGEKRLYAGAQNNVSSFFDNFDYPAFFLRKDFSKYLADAKLEYEDQEQGYRKNLAPFWQENLDELSKMDGNIFYFQIENAIGEQDANRYYIRSQDDIYKYMRTAALPQISYVSILKIKSPEGQIYYYFRLFLDYYGPTDHPSIIREEEEEIESSEEIPEVEREQLIRARVGQGAYRQGLLREIVSCVITGVTDERLLIASHLKPWSMASNEEKLDPKNGLPLTPTYDKMVDKGFISFEDDGTIIISPWISPLNIKKLSLRPGVKYQIPLGGREKYLKFHRENIFKS